MNGVGSTNRVRPVRFQGQVSAQTFTLKQLFEAGTYDIEYYQREYAWSEEDVRILITDLCDEFDRLWRSSGFRRRRSGAEPFFLGPFVYYEEPGSVRFLVDGQQRFTTLHLIFVHLYRLAKDLVDPTTADKLSRVITDYEYQRERFRLDIEERRDALHALYHGRVYEPPRNASLSLRTLWRRSKEISELIDARLEGETCGPFVDWLLNHVVLVGIQALSRDNGFRIFESMNDRGAQLTQVDLVKSFLLSSVGTAEEELNKRWRTMLAELTRARDDRDAPRRFLVAALLARWAEVGEDDAADEVEINQAVNTWIRKPENRRLTKLDGGEDFFRFVDDLIGLSTHYATFLRATGEPYEVNSLSAIFYNHVNGLTNQMNLILAAIQPKDTATEANAKAALVANHLDRLYVLRALDYEPVDARSFDRDIRRLIPQLRKCSTRDEVARALAEEMSADPFYSMLDFRMQGNNKAQVRYVLARLTSYAQRGCKKNDRITDYIGEERQWEIEHLWPDHPEQYQTDVSDPVMFRTLRSRVGALVLLPERDNKSLNDTPLAEKISRYGRQNSLVAVLDGTYLRNHPDLRDFIKSNGIEKYFRNFGPKDNIETVVSARAELYRRLCLRIWDLERLGFPAPPATTEVAGTSPPNAEGVGRQAKQPRKRRLQTDVAKMVRAGILPPNSLLVGSYAGIDHHATVDADGMIVLSTGVAYDRADEAARIACGRKRDGMSFWQLQAGDGRQATLRQLRDQAVSG